MAEVGTTVGAILMGIGGVSVLYGAVMCYLSPNQYYNKEDVESMVAATVLAEKQRKAKHDSYFDNPENITELAKKNRRVLQAS